LAASGVTLGRRVLLDRGLNFSVNFYWISIGALIGFIFLCNIGFAIGLTIKKRKFIILNFSLNSKFGILIVPKYNWIIKLMKAYAEYIILTSHVLHFQLQELQEQLFLMISLADLIEETSVCLWILKMG
jgi:hypothetical protein